MDRLLRSFAALTVVLALCGSQAANAQSPKALKKATLMLNWYPYGEHAAFYYGLQKGFFKDEGIDLTIQPGGGSAKTVQAVAAGQIQFGWADAPSVIKNVSAGASVKSIGVFLQTTPASIEYFATQNIHKPSDLKGKTVAVTPGDALFQTFPAFLAANKLSPDDVHQVNIDPAGKLAALIEGKVDTLIGFFNDQAPTIEQRSGKKVDVLKFADHGVNFYGTGVVVSDDLLKSDAPLAKAFMKATIRSWEEAEKHRADAVAAEETLAEKAPPKDVLAHQFDLTLSLLHTPGSKGKKPGINNAKDWQNTIDLFAKYSEIKNAGPPSAYWDGSIAGS